MITLSHFNIVNGVAVLLKFGRHMVPLIEVHT